MNREPFKDIRCPNCKGKMITGYVYGDRYRPVFIETKVQRLKAYLEGYRISGSCGILDFFAARCEKCHLILLKEGYWNSP